MAPSVPSSVDAKVETNATISVLVSASSTRVFWNSCKYHFTVKPAHTAFRRDTLNE